MAITETQARERFGMTTQDAHRVRDLAMQRLTPSEVTAARKAWQAMVDLACKSAQHPEAVRFRFLSALADGASVADAEAAARAYAAGNA